MVKISFNEGIYVVKMFLIYVYNNIDIIFVHFNLELDFIVASKDTIRKYSISDYTLINSISF